MALTCGNADHEAPAKLVDTPHGHTGPHEEPQMAPTPQPYRAKDGTVTWYVRYRIKGRPNPTKDTFGPYDDDPGGERARVEAEKFARLVERVGGEAARATRRSSEGSARTMPTLAT